MGVGGGGWVPFKGLVRMVGVGRHWMGGSKRQPPPTHPPTHMRRLAASLPHVSVVGGAGAEASPLVHLRLAPQPPPEEVRALVWAASVIVRACLSVCGCVCTAACARLGMGGEGQGGSSLRRAPGLPAPP